MDRTRTACTITEEIPNRVAADKALARVMTAVLKDDPELFKQFMDNESFRRWMTDTVFALTYGAEKPGLSSRSTSPARRTCRSRSLPALA